jgi:hypothetical protein
MLSRTLLLTRIALALMLLAVPLALARGQRLDDGEVEFDQKLRKSKSLIRDLFSGAVPVDPRSKDHREAIDLAAKSVTYPLYWKTQASRPPEGKIDQIVLEFESELSKLTKARGATQALVPLYCKDVVEHALEVAQKGKPIASVNACRLLAAVGARRMERYQFIPEKAWFEEVMPRLAEGTGEALANACLTILADPKCTDANRYWAFQALASLLAMPRQPNPLVKPDTLEKICAAAGGTILKRTHFPKATPRAEVEGYKVMRLQAIKALAQSRVPAIGKERPALVLAKVASNDQSLEPSPRIEERVEAVVGLGLMGPAAAKANDYHADYAVSQVCRAVADFGNAAGGNLDSKPVVKQRPWKVDAGRMLEALDVLKDAVKLPYVQEAVKQCVAVLAPIEGGRAGPANDLSDWVVRNEPANKTLFRGDAASVVKPAEPPKE